MSDYICGRWAIQEALQQEATRVSKVFLSSKLRGPSVDEIEKLAKEKGIVVQKTHDRDLDRRAAGGVHQGMVAEVLAKPPMEFREFLDSLSGVEKPGPVVLLDGIEDPQNLGAILRSAAFFGAAGVIVPKRRSAQPTPLVAKISSGGIEQVSVIQVANIAESIEALKKEGFWVAGADAGTGEKLEKLEGSKIALVIGSEGAGMGRLVKERCDFLVKIPTKSKMGPASLNASCAAAVLLYVATRTAVSS